MNSADEDNFNNPATSPAITTVVAGQRFAAVYAAKAYQRRDGSKTKPNYTNLAVSHLLKKTMHVVTNVLA